MIPTAPDSSRHSADLSGLLAAVTSYRGPPASIMEVCGTHTVAIARLGLRSLLPQNLKLLSGPGCPVCVTPADAFDRAIHLAVNEGVMVATFGDALRVPGSKTTLLEARAKGAPVHPVYSAYDALKLARANPARQVAFLGLGFETTSPTVAKALLSAKREGLKNFTLLSAHKALMPALDALASDPELKVDAFLCPGHASMVIGSDAYLGFAEKFRLPCVVTGFEPEDVLLGLAKILAQVSEGRVAVENAYPRAVTPKGNIAAMAALAEVFELADTSWRGLGELPGSGYALRSEFSEFDAEKRFLAGLPFPAAEPPGCSCAQVLRGRMSPEECPLFATACTPPNPVGACMVSSEGACGAHYRYRGV